jgi:hypothetical protein
MPDDMARLYVLEAIIEILKAENESLKRQLAAAETRAAWAAIVERLAAPAAGQAGLQDRSGGDCDNVDLARSVNCRLNPTRFMRRPCSL